MNNGSLDYAMTLHHDLDPAVYAKMCVEKKRRVDLGDKYEHPPRMMQGLESYNFMMNGDYVKIFALDSASIQDQRERDSQRETMAANRVLEAAALAAALESEAAAAMVERKLAALAPQQEVVLGGAAPAVASSSNMIMQEPAVTPEEVSKDAGAAAAAPQSLPEGEGAGETKEENSVVSREVAKVAASEGTAL
jgi:hypothetical protein